MVRPASRATRGLVAVGAALIGAALLGGSASTAQAQVGERVALVIEAADAHPALDEALSETLRGLGLSVVEPSAVRAARAFTTASDGEALEAAGLESLRAAVRADGLVVVDLRSPTRDRLVLRVRVWASGRELAVRFGETADSTLVQDVVRATREMFAEAFGWQSAAPPVAAPPAAPVSAAPALGPASSGAQAPPVVVAPEHGVAGLASETPAPPPDPAAPSVAGHPTASGASIPPDARAIGGVDVGGVAIDGVAIDGPAAGGDGVAVEPVENMGALRVQNDGNRDVCVVMLHPVSGNPNAALRAGGVVPVGASREARVPAGPWRAEAILCSGTTVARESVSVVAGGETTFEVGFEIRHPFRVSASALLIGHLYSVGYTSYGALALGAHASAAFQLSESDEWGIGIDAFFTSQTMLDNADVGFVGGMLVGLSRGPGVLAGIGWMNFTSNHYGFAIGAHTPLFTFAKVMAVSISAVVGFSEIGSELVIYTQLGAGLGIHY